MKATSVTIKAYGRFIIADSTATGTITAAYIAPAYGQGFDAVTQQVGG